MEREPSTSSNIKSVGYEDGVMEVEFKGGSVYRYHVPKEVYEAFKASGFRGGHFHKNIKSLYEGTKT
jgi:hypothetical protein